MAPDGNGNHGNLAVSVGNDSHLQGSLNGIEIHQKEPFGTKSGSVVAPEVAELSAPWEIIPLELRQSILAIAKSASRAYHSG